MHITSTKKIGLAAICAVSLSACGPETSPNAQNLSAQPVTQSIGQDNVALFYNENTKTFVVTVNGVAQTDMVAEAGANHGQMQGLKNAGNTKYGAFGQTDHSLVVVGGTENDASPYGGVIYSRLTDTTMPTSGNAAFTGDYSGLLRRDGTPSNDVTRRVRGDVTLTADFSAGSISGTIANRALYSPGTNTIDATNTLSNVNLSNTSISGNGAFSGAATGGEINRVNSTWNQATGTYEGVFSGPDAGEAVGGISIAHTLQTSPTSYTELGGFIATK